MKNIYYLLSLCSIGLMLSCSNISTKDKEEILTTNLDGTITIQGRVLVQGIDQPLKGINTVNIMNKWTEISDKYGIKGENPRVYVDKKGFYKITIRKGDTIQFIPNNVIYEQNLNHYKVSGFSENSIIDFLVRIDSTPYLQAALKYPETIPALDKFLNETDPENLYTLSGIITKKETGKPIKKKPIYFYYHNTTNGSLVHSMTDDYGQFSVTTPYNTLIEISASNHPSKTKNIYVTKDTVANISL